MDKVLVFHSPADETYGVVRITNYKLYKAVRKDADEGMGFDELIFKHKLKQLEGECVQIKGD